MRLFLKTSLLSLLFQQASFVLSTAIYDSIDVAVIGAGLSGLTAARDLLDAGKSVIVLEARNRVGGKVYGKPLADGGVTEVGAEFVGPTQDKVLGMISDLGLQTFQTYSQGRSVLWRNDTRHLFTPDPELGGAPLVHPSSLVQITNAQAQLDEWAAELNTSAPWIHPQAEKWDSQTFDAFISQNANHSDARFMLTTACKAIFAAEPKELSLLYVLAYVAAAGNESTTGTLSRLIATKDGAQESRVIGGTGLIPQRLADVGYDVRSRAGTIIAKNVVLAMSPPLLRQIIFKPALPLPRQKLNEQTKMPALGKGIAIYEPAFWRSTENLSAQVNSDAGSVRVTFDSTPDDASFGAILGFILGDEIRTIDKLSVVEGESRIISDYVRYYGKQAANVTEFVLFRWDLEEWSRGGPVAVAPPRVLTKYGSALRQSAAGLHFAGTETSEYWTGYMDGAIRSGERVAQEILRSS
ncbi:amine oxidase [Didymella exigua CBS 183.55]|uniref:Amine oxidase n=1 Tax=Didymella exigua CBS 183.55 TaxID=1150837 RepID=A0A6A5R4N3_9PLEO|nr:amine oxidase [Didymella exigua CBS 183.55]KAF1922583.1 amine oxidase [Didymella exigua CBS 183.55]